MFTKMFDLLFPLIRYWNFGPGTLPLKNEYRYIVRMKDKNGFKIFSKWWNIFNM